MFSQYIFYLGIGCIQMQWFALVIEKCSRVFAKQVTDDVNRGLLRKLRQRFLSAIRQYRGYNIHGNTCTVAEIQTCLQHQQGMVTGFGSL